MVPAHPPKILFVMSDCQWQDNGLQNTESNVLCVLLLTHISRRAQSKRELYGNLNLFEALSFDYAQDDQYFMTYSQAVLNGDRLALSRLLTQVENDAPEGRAALVELFPHTGKAHLIGVTGAPGTGKSSLVNQLALYYRKTENKRVAIVAVDPSSPFTGGAVLGDRVRMRDLAGDTGVFIRSMATRGSLGGLAQSTANMVQVFDAAGFDVIIIETVGAGQSEVDVARLAHTTLVVEAPGLGDDIQAIKAGILEIADILVVNKADRPGVENDREGIEVHAGTGASDTACFPASWNLYECACSRSGFAKTIVDSTHPADCLQLKAKVSWNWPKPLRGTWRT